jgi:integrase
MAELQLHTGMRPIEVRFMRPADIDRTGPVWVYRPTYGKMSYAEVDRDVLIGPRAQSILSPWLERADPEAFLFSPANNRAERFAAWRAARKSKVQPSQLARRKAPADLVKRVRDQFTSDGYAAVVRRACLRADIPPWHPNQLRHTFGTEVRRKYGLEAAQVILGHARADVTQMYAERDRALAARVAAEIG